MAQVLPFNGFYTGNDKKNSARECVNYIPIKHDSGALSEYTLEATQGIGSKITTDYTMFIGDPFEWTINETEKLAFILASDPAFPYNGYLIATDGQSIIDSERIFTVIPDGVTESVSATSAQYAVVLINNEIDNYGVLSGVDSEMNSLSTETLPVGVYGNDIEYFGARFLVTSRYDSTAGQKNGVYYTDINDPETIDPLSFFSDIDQTTENVGLHAMNDRLYLFSKNGYSVWANTSDVNLPFSKQKGSTGSIGLISRKAKVEVGGVLYFVGLFDGLASLWALSGGSSQDLGNEYINHYLKDSKDVSLFSFNDKGRVFIAISTDDSEDKTLCYDIKSGEFHARSTKIDGVESPWSVFGVSEIRSQSAVSSVVFSQSDALDGERFKQLAINVFDDSIGTEFERPVIRRLVTSPFNSDGVTNNVRELSFQASVDYSTYSLPISFETGEEIPPSLGLSVSSDFGFNYGDVRYQYFDGSDEYDKLMRFMGIGFFRQAFVFKLETNNIYPHKILKMLTRIEKGFRQI